MPTKKSDLLNKLADNYPNFFKKDLIKLIDILMIEIKNSLKRKERVELRDIFTLEPKLQKAKYARNPKTNEKIFVKEKYSINFKLSKYWSKKINEKNKVFVACDTTDIRKIKKIIKETQNKEIFFGYKFGLEFLNSKNGREFIQNLKKQITFGDFKFSDIPNTCASAIKAVSDLKFNYITIHINAGFKALKEAKKVAGKTKLIGVTILTSLNNKAIKEIGFNKNVKDLVIHQARLATKAKLDAIVCSAQEVKLVKKVFKKEIITPGIRLDSKKDDQKRVLTPYEAYKNGADWLVIGRDVTKGNIKNNIQKLINHLDK